MLQLACTVERFLLLCIAGGKRLQSLGFKIVKDHSDTVTAGSALLHFLGIVGHFNPADFPLLHIEQLNSAGGIELTPCVKGQVRMGIQIRHRTVSIQDRTLGGISAVVILGHDDGISGGTGAFGTELHAAPGAGRIQINAVARAEGYGLQLLKCLPCSLRGMSVGIVISAVGQIIIRCYMCACFYSKGYRDIFTGRSNHSQLMFPVSQSLEHICIQRNLISFHFGRII